MTTVEDHLVDPQKFPVREDLKYTARGTMAEKTVFQQNFSLLKSSNNSRENILHAVTYNANEKPLQFLAHPIKQNNKIIQNGFAFLYNDDGSIKISYLKGDDGFQTGYIFDFNPSSGMVFGVTQYTNGQEKILFKENEVFVESSSQGIAVWEQIAFPLETRLKTETPADGVEMDYLPRSGQLYSLRIKLQNEDTLHMFFAKKGAFKRVYIKRNDLKIGPELVAKELPDKEVPVLDEVRENEIIQDYSKKFQSVPRDVFALNDAAVPVKEEIHSKGLLHMSFTYFDDLSVANMDSFEKVRSKQMVAKQGNCYSFYRIPPFKELGLSPRVHRITRYPAVAELFQYDQNDGSCLYTGYDPQGNTKESGYLNAVGKPSGEWIFYDEKNQPTRETYFNGINAAGYEEKRKRLNNLFEDEKARHEEWVQTPQPSRQEGGPLSNDTLLIRRHQDFEQDLIVCGTGTIRFSNFLNFLAKQVFCNGKWATFSGPVDYIGYANNHPDQDHHFSVRINMNEKDGQRRTVATVIADTMGSKTMRITCDFGLFYNNQGGMCALAAGDYRISFDTNTFREGRLKPNNSDLPVVCKAEGPKPKPPVREMTSN